ncbi:uncharacterized protein B0T15DRAFT_87702 [Chaetomium strumarium]|uniref:Uncharacterized protein n=1 Tax=Chaetomium strumarium TaxID=1170767 RepID=A0AAJ0GXD3_9PEZI|nr:hypothetical protein B0T15DRAFT_87702 [Chaetomium strumarium]
MAATTPFDITGLGSSYAFDIYNDAHALPASAPALPGGPCNYTDQTLPRCGCRRFWSRASLSSGIFQDNAVSSQAEVCMCSHHACFHEDVQPGQAQTMAMTATGSQENQMPKPIREPLSPAQAFASLHMPATSGTSLDLNLLGFHTSGPVPRMDPANPAQAEDTRPAQDSLMPDTFNSWSDLRPQVGHANGMTPFHAQSLMSPAPPPSTASSSQGRYLRPFAGKGLQTLSGASGLRSEARRPERINEESGPETIADPGCAATEAASTPKALPSQARSASEADAAYQKLADRVDSHEQRLDRLESTSFSIAGHDDCHDKHEHTDLRVTELESRVEEVEKILNDNGSVVSGRRTAKQDGGADDATASVVSVSTNATVTAATRAEVYSQLQQLQAQVSQLQAASLPSYTKPWELEVVYLPFPLKGIWVEAKDFYQRRSIGSNADDWTQMPNTISRATPDPQSPKFQEWAGQGPDSNWLLPRAFVAGRVIDQRLKSRGLIKTVLVRGPDARSVQLAIHNAFGDILRIGNSDARPGLAPEYPLAEFLGLRHAWVPLRKLHKDSRLRFLAPAEMATPALWDFTFLVSSVVMKATGVQRLYITQPEAYLQDHPLGYHALQGGWTWQKLRQLSRVYPDSQSSAGDVPEADALEECWNWNERLDEMPSIETSAISLRRSIHERASRRSSTEPSGQFYTGVQSPILSNGPSRSRAQSPLIQRERKGSWPPNIRTGSLPPVGPGLMSPAQSRRRVSTHATSITPYERRASPFVPRATPRPSPRLSAAHHGHIPSTSAAAAVPKRRFTRSPSLIPRNTPRWSRTSMSRSPSLAPGGPYGFHDDRERENRERRTTPFYYATPHSEAVHEPYGYHRAGSRGPPPAAVLRTNGYEPDDDEDEEMGFDDTDHGSGTDGYDDENDSEMTNADDDHHQRHSRQSGSGRRRLNGQHPGPFGFNSADVDGDDADLDIDVYEDEDEDELDGVDTDVGNNNNNPHHHHHHHHQSNRAWHGFGRQRVTPSQPSHHQALIRPEDIPWAGIEDGADAEGDSNMSDGENIDPTTGASSSSQSQSHHSQPEEIEIHQDDDVRGPENDDDEEEEEGDGSSSEAPSVYESKPVDAWQLVPSVPGPASIETMGMGQKQLSGSRRGGGAGESSMMGFRIHEDGTATAAGGGGDGGGGLEAAGGVLDMQWG